MNNTEEIKALLERYYLGTTTLDQERRLRELMVCHPATGDPEIDATRDMLTAFDATAVETGNAGGRFTPPMRRLWERSGVVVAACAMVAVILTLTLRPARLPESYAMVDGQMSTDSELITELCHEALASAHLHDFSHYNTAVRKALAPLSKVAETTERTTKTNNI